MTVGFVLLCHASLNRAAQVARHLARHGCPVVIHVDARVSKARYDGMVAGLADHENIRFCARHRCEWGTWSLVAASQSGAELLLDAFPHASHVFLASGACLPLRPPAELNAYLDARGDTDFIESVTTEDVPWTKGGLDGERFTLWFPLSWKRHRRLFDLWVWLQRKTGLRRRVPDGLVPHMGSQWWCLTRRTVAAILSGPDRARHDAFFRRVWIPDESYWQTLARIHSRRIESRSLTLAKFDFQGKPHIFYDDHLQLLRRSDCFVARKIWPRAGKLYSTFLSDRVREANPADPEPGKIDRIFAKATERRTRGRPGLYMQSRFPNPGWENGRTCAPYWVFEGFDELFEGFARWLHRTADAQVHGHLFGPRRAVFADGATTQAGALSDNAALRDANPAAFLTSLLWNTRNARQCFSFGPRDTQAIGDFMAYDGNARINVISGAWALGLFRSKRDFTAVRKSAARLQRIEAAHLELLRNIHIRAQVRIWPLADFVLQPATPIQAILAEIGMRDAKTLAELPRMVDLAGFGRFLQNLRNEGMEPHLVGDFQSGAGFSTASRDARKPFLVR